MGFYDAVLARHSVREFSATPIPDDKLHRVMEAVRLSPSGGNGQGYKYMLVKDPTLRQGLAKAAGNQEWIADAPVVVACCSQPELPVGDGDDFGRQVNALRWGLPAVEMMEGMEDKELLALLMGNAGTLISGTHLTLAAAAEGLGTCWIGYLDVEAASGLLGLPDDWRCYFLIPIGYPAVPPAPGGHDRLPLKDTVFGDEWGVAWENAEKPCPLDGYTGAPVDTVAGIINDGDWPEPFTPSDDLFWDHPHIAKGMLEAHLNPDWDAASRKPGEIDAIVGFLSDRMGLREGMAFLDCGCGPGLYCTRFARRGLAVTGVDYSRNSLAHAERKAMEDGLDIRYIRRDYLTMDFEGEFDAACIIYMDFGVLSPPNRARFLANVRKALKPGGRFALDAWSVKAPLSASGTSDWSQNPNGGFWRPGPYLELKRNHVYPESMAHLEHVTIIEPGGVKSVYRLWDQLFTPESLTRELTQAGFTVEGMWETLSGKELTDDSPSLAVVARA